MKKLKFRVRPRLLILAALLLLSFVTPAVGKYITTVSVTGNNVTFTANLATSVVLQESEVYRQDDGSYELLGEKTQEKNEYILIPGLDIPKDPHIVITGKTEHVPAYLFIEVVDTLDEVNGTKLVDYSVTSEWGKASNMKPKHGGTVYVYTGDGNVPKALTSDPENPIYILTGNSVTVSQYVKSKDITVDGDTDILTFYAYLVEAASFNTAS